MSYSDTGKVNITRIVSLNMKYLILTTVLKCCFLGKKNLTYLKQHLGEPRPNPRFLEFTCHIIIFTRYPRLRGSFLQDSGSTSLKAFPSFVISLFLPSSHISIPVSSLFSLFLWVFEAGAYLRVDFELVAILLPQVP